MTERVQITIEGSRYAEGEKEEMGLTAVGEYFQKDGSHYIRYDETEEGGEVIRNMIKLRSDCMEMIKKGAVTSRMVFCRGRTTCTPYTTPAGRLSMEIRTGRLAVLVLGEGKLEAEAEYSLTINGQYLSDNKVTVRVEHMARPCGM